MSVYRISDIVKALNDFKKDGFEYVELSILDDDPESPSDTLFISAIVSDDETVDEMIDSIPLPDGYSLD